MARVFRRLLQRVAARAGKSRVGDKDPRSLDHLAAWKREFPDARVVVMMRDPTECIPSCLKLVESNWKAKGWQQPDYERSLEVLTQLSFESFDLPKRD